MSAPEPHFVVELPRRRRPLTLGARLALAAALSAGLWLALGLAVARLGR